MYKNNDFIRHSLEGQYFVLTHFDDELMHYGVKGMRWGVKKAKKSYAKATTKEQRAKLDAKMKNHKEKAKRELNKLERQRPKLERNAQDARLKTDARAAKLERRASIYRSKAYTTFGKNKAGERLYKAEKYKAQADALRAKSERAKLALANNKEMTEIYRKGIKEIDKLMVDKGRQYARYDQTIAKAKKDYESGKISRRQRRYKIRDTKYERKNYLNAI